MDRFFTDSDTGNQNFGKLLEEKLPFLGMTIGHLIVQLFVLYITLSLCNKNEELKEKIKGNNFLLVILVLLVGLVLAFMIGKGRYPIFLKIMIFTLYSSILGSLFSVILEDVDESIIKKSIFITAGIFVGMFAIAFALIKNGYGDKIDIFGKYLMMFFIFLFLLSSSLAIYAYFGTKKDMENYRYVRNNYFSYMFILLFSGFIIYDTKVIVVDDSLDWVDGSFTYFLDVINIFLELIRSSSG